MAKPKIQVLVDWNNDGDFADTNDDVTANIRSLATDHIRDLDSELMTGHALDMELNNEDHLYSPPNGGGALSGDLKPGRKVWARAFYPYDTFAGTVNTALPSHTPDEDGDWTWVNNVNSFELDGSGAARTDAAGSGDFIATLDFLDVDVTIGANIFRGTDTTDDPGLTVRFVDASNYAYIRVTDINANNVKLELRKVIATVDSQVAISASNISWNRSSTKFVSITLHGTSVRAFVTRESALPAGTTMNDAAINAGTKHGLFCDDQADHRWQDFGGYKSIFYGSIVKIQPRPALGDEYCYIQAKDVFEEFKTIPLRAYNSFISAPQNIAEMMGGLLTAGDFTTTDRLLEAGTDLFEDDSGIQSIISDLLSACYALQESEDGFVYVDGLGFVILENRDHRTTAPHTTSKATYFEERTGTQPYFSGIQWSDGIDHIENRVIVRYRVGTLSGTVQMWEHEGAKASPSVLAYAQSDVLQFIAETKDYDTWVTRTFATVTDFAANTQADGLGADTTADFALSISVEATRFGGRYAKIQVTENGTGAGFITLLKARGTGITNDDPTEVDDTDATSQASFGARRKEIDSVFITRDAQARALAVSRVARRKDPKTELSLTIRPGDKVTMHDIIQRVISDRVTVDYTAMGISEDFFIEGESWRIGRGGTMTEQLLQLRGV